MYGWTPMDLTPYNGKVLFAGFDASGDRSLWVTQRHRHRHLQTHRGPGRRKRWPVAYGFCQFVR